MMNLVPPKRYIPSGLKYASKILSERSEFLIYYDPDIDGVVAGELSRRVCEAFNKPYMYHINENRAHGMFLNSGALKQLSGKTMLIVDAHITTDDLKLCLEHNVSVINIDHHEIESKELVYLEHENGAKGVIINNQYDFEPEEFKFLSGAGVVYYTFENMFPGFFDDDARSLVGLSLISDIRKLENDIARSFLNYTFYNNSQYIKYLIAVSADVRDYGFGERVFDRTFIEYTFSPRVNALFRLNMGADAIAIFSGRWTETGKLEQYKTMQNAIVDTMMVSSVRSELENLELLYVDVNTLLPYNGVATNFIGLIASKVKNDGKTTVAYVRDGNKIVRGSVRGMMDNGDYLTLFREFGFTCEGHKTAFGIHIDDLNSVDFEKLNSAIAGMEKDYDSKKYENRIIEIQNLDFFLSGRNAQIADINNYVRDQHRYYIRYTGDVRDVKVTKFKKAVKYLVDGHDVLAFDDLMSLDKDLILPLKERNKYINFYLRKF